MLYYTNIVLYLWLLPVFAYFFIPIALAIATLFIRMGQRFFYAGEVTNEEKRKHPRLSASRDIVAKITVGDTTCTGIVCDVSKTGVSLKHLPDMISHEIDKLSVVISHYGIDYNLLFRTKWIELTASGRRLGAEIDSTSHDWSKFLLQTEKAGQAEAI
jgi:hypothetical protein